MRRASPPRVRRSREWVSCSTIPATMNSGALKSAWLRMCSIATVAAGTVPIPSSIVTRPRWLTVDQASRPLRSVSVSAKAAPASMVARPTPLTIQNHSGVPAKTGQSRAIRNSPAFTMVAECR